MLADDGGPSTLGRAAAASTCNGETIMSETPDPRPKKSTELTDLPPTTAETEEVKGGYASFPNPVSRPADTAKGCLT